ncbi:MAG: hypothetical protein EZS28_022898, partial [Streblomastix strix]
MNQRGLIDVTATTTIVEGQDYIGADRMNISVNIGTDEYIVRTCTLTNCLKGAIYFELSNGGKSSVINSQFTGCQINGSGGAIYINLTRGGEAQVSNSQFTGCQSSYSGGAINANIQSGSILTIDGQCRFTECSTQYSGGGINAQIEGENSKLIFGDGLIFHTCSSNYNGGGIYVYIITGAQLIFEGNCQFKDCSANIISGGGIYAECLGEGSQIRSLGELLFDNCSAFSRGGGGACIHSLNYAFIELNKVTCIDCKSEDGGGIEILIGSNTVLTLSGQASFTRCESIWFGGGIFFSIQRENVEIRITGSMDFVDCTSYFGGGININAQSKIILTISSSCTFLNCTGQEGGGMYLFSGSIDSYIQIAGGGGYFFTSSKGHIVTNNVTCKDCKAYEGGGIFINSQDEISVIELSGIMTFVDCIGSHGGGLYIRIRQSGQVIISNRCTFTRCIAEYGGGIYIDSYDYGNLVIISGYLSFEFCEAQYTGGGLYASNINGSGGGIYSGIDDGSLNIEDTIFDRCSSTQPGKGGGIALIQGISSIISITNSSFINCKTISNSSNQRYGWGGAIFIQTSVTAKNLNESNFQLRDLVFTGCSTVNSIGNNIHIQSSNTYNTGIAIALNSLLTVKDTPNLYTSPEYSNDYMGIDQSKFNYGDTQFTVHEPLFLAAQTDSVIKQYYIRSYDSFNENDCSSTSPCKTINYILSQTPPEGFVKGLSVAIINVLSDSSDQDEINLNNQTKLNNIITIQSDGYQPEENYTKQSISTSSFNKSLFTIAETGHLSLLGLHFDNLNPSSTNPLISLSTDDNNQIPRLTIIDCEFNQDQTPNPIPDLSHSIISINGGQMIISRTKIENYKFNNEKSLIMIKSNQNSSSEYYRKNQIEITQSTFSNISLSGSGNGTSINAQIGSNSQLLIDVCQFIQCKGIDDIRGGAIYLNINNQGQVTISNSSFIQCETNSIGGGFIGGGAIYINIQDQAACIIKMVIFDECKTFSTSLGGGIYLNNNYGGQITLSNSSFIQCEAFDGGAIFLYINIEGQVTISNSLFIQCKVSDYGGAICLNISIEGQVIISNSSFDQCEAEFYGGGISAWEKSGGKLTINGQCNFTQCKAWNSGAIDFFATEMNCQLILDDGVKFEGCQSLHWGGGMFIYIQEQASCIINKVQFKDCSADRGGGIILFPINQMTQIFNGTQFINCQSQNGGGGMEAQLQQENSILELINVMFQNCNILGDEIREGDFGRGGGLYAYVADGGQFTISEKCQFKDCSSDLDGGGCFIYCAGIGSQFQINGQLEFNNCSANTGGGMFISIFDQRTVNFNQISFKDCSAEFGGGIYSIIRDIGQLRIMNQSIFTECRSISGSGGGIYSDIIDGTLNIEDTTFDSCNCTQPGNGGGIALIQGISSIISITNSSFINCETISNSSDQSYGWGGAVFIQTSVTAENLNETNFLLRDLVFTECLAVNSIGNNIHIQSSNTYNTGIAIALNSLLTVKDTPNLYTSPEYSNDYMGIDQSKVIDGNEPYSVHEPLFLAAQTDSVTKQYYIRQLNSFDENECSSTSPCKTINYILSQTPPEGFVKGLSVAIINVLSDSSDQDEINLNNQTILNNIITIQSDGYQPQDDSYNQQSISTSLFSASLFIITETGHLSLLGLHFDNLYPSSTNSLISLSHDDNNQIPRLTIIDCEFNQDQTPNPIPDLSPSIISINGGQMIISKTK